MSDPASTHADIRSHTHSHSSTQSLRPLAVLALGRTGADIERLVREARLAARRERRAIVWADLERALQGDRKPMSDALLWRICIHEAGHAIAWTLLEVGEVVTVMIGGAEFGQVMSRRFEDLPQTEDWLMRTVACLLAGRVAETMVFGDTVAGAGGGEDSDLAKATTLALAAETMLGFSSDRPLLYRNPRGNLDLVNLDRDLAAQVNERLLAAEQMARELLEARRPELTEIARRLKRKGIVEGSDVCAVLGVEALSSHRQGEAAPK